MGNCGRKMKKEWNYWYNRRRNPNARIGQGMQCPKCGMSFGPNTSYYTVNFHLDSCLVTQESIENNPNPPPVIQATHANQISTMLANQNQISASQPSTWIKKTTPDNKIVWEKVVHQKPKADDYLCNMTMKSAKELNFEDKLKWFSLQTAKFKIPWTYGADNLEISEKNLVDSTIKNIKKVNLHKEVKIVFEEERKINDAGGLLREFVNLYSKEVFKAEKGLFVQGETEEVYYHINPRAADSKENLETLKVLGRIVGKAILEQLTVPMQLSRMITKQMIGVPVTLEDLMTYDKSLYKSLKFILETSISNDDIFEEYFTVYDPQTGNPHELKTNGATIRIDDSNKEEFVKLKVEWLCKKSIEKKISSLLDGLYMVIPNELLQIYSVDEFEMVLNGLPFIDLADWEYHTNYKGSYYKNHQVIKWFWQTMKELDQEQLAKFYQFCTGSTHPPVEGFRSLQSNRGELHKFNVESVKLTSGTGMKAHTCFNRLELPMYNSREQLKENLINILKTDFNGVFGIE